MSRQLLLNEIERLYIEGIEPKENLRDEVYVRKNYPYLEGLFGQYKYPYEKWEQVVREVLFYDKEDINYMYNRTMQLLRRFSQATTNYFKLSTSTGTYILPDRLSDLNRMFELYLEFFLEIYPKLINELNFGVFSQERISNELFGVINWNKTILHSLEYGSSSAPTEFVTSIPKSHFDTPENQLLMVSIVRMRYDAIFLLGFPFGEELSMKEKMILTQIANGCNRILKNTILQELIPKASKYLLLDAFDSRLRSLESQVNSRIRDGIIRKSGYKQLFEWTVKYRELNLRTVALNRTNFPIDRLRNLDTMYEVWILFELLNLLSDKGAMIRTGNFQNDKSFLILLNNVEFKLYYEKIGGYSGWASDGNPDFTIEKDGKLKVIMDAKNWLQQKDEAVYKMLGYLNNLDCELGVLFFSTDKKLARSGTVRPVSPLKSHFNQCLVNVVAPFSASSENIEIKQKALSELLDVIVVYIK